jgi:hypothetical protein
MRIIRMFACIAAIAFAGVAYAQAPTSPTARSIELAISDETAQLRYDGPTHTGGEGSRMQYSLFLSEQRDVVGSAALLMDSSTLEIGAFDFKFGPQAYAALLDEENEDVFSLALGIEARFDFLENYGIAIVGSAFYGPDILTFGSADNLTDFMARAEIRLNERLVGFAGYRWFELDVLEQEERKLQNEVFAGVRYELR